MLWEKERQLRKVMGPECVPVQVVILIVLVIGSPSLQGTVGAREATEEGNESRVCTSLSGRIFSVQVTFTTGYCGSKRGS